MSYVYKTIFLLKVPRLEASPRTSLKFCLLPESNPLPRLNLLIQNSGHFGKLNRLGIVSLEVGDRQVKMRMF